MHTLMHTQRHHHTHTHTHTHTHKYTLAPTGVELAIRITCVTACGPLRTLNAGSVDAEAACSFTRIVCGRLRSQHRNMQACMHLHTLGTAT
jgi:hypothetical protein